MTSQMSTPKTVGARIAWARKRKGMSQIRLAELVGTSQRHISRLENSPAAVPRKATREKLAAALDQDPAFFANEDDDEEADPLASVSIDELLRLRVEKLAEKLVDARLERMLAERIGMTA